MLQCNGCGSQVFTDCACPPGHDAAAAGAHHDSCPHSDLDGQLACRCCPENHDHAAAANACPGGHDDAPCPEPRDCRLWKNATVDARHPLYEGGHPLLAPGHRKGDPVPDCPGGHCHKDVPGCAICRPVTITVIPGSTTIQTAGA